jgi:phosphopantothenoylcysteine decarboxylase
MWRHPITAKQIRVLAEDWGIKEPVSTEGEENTTVPELSESEGWFQVIKARPLPAPELPQPKFLR